MCNGDDTTCPHFEQHRRDFLETMDHERRAFLKSAFVAGGGAAALGAGGLSLVTLLACAFFTAFTGIYS